MTVWMLATLACAAAAAVPAMLACRGATNARLTAIQLMTAAVTWVLVLMTFAFDQSAFVDLALALALMALPGTLAMSLFLERWL